MRLRENSSNNLPQLDVEGAAQAFAATRVHAIQPEDTMAAVLDAEHIPTLTELAARFGAMPPTGSTNRFPATEDDVLQPTIMPIGSSNSSTGSS